MATEDNKELIANFVKESADVVGDVNKSITLLDKYYTPDCVFHFTSAGDVHVEQYKQLAPYILNAFPDYTITIEDIVAEGDKVITRFIFAGTHKGEYLGVAPTGKKITMNIVNIYRIAGGKIAENWLLPDTFDLMIQLGAIPNPYVQR